MREPGRAAMFPHCTHLYMLEPRSLHARDPLIGARLRRLTSCFRPLSAEVPKSATLLFRATQHCTALHCRSSKSINLSPGESGVPLRVRFDVPTAAGVVVVTGASSGIGLAAALHATDLGFTVYAGVRSSEAAAAVRTSAGASRTALRVLVLDVTPPDSVKSNRQCLPTDQHVPWWSEAVRGIRIHFCSLGCPTSPSRALARECPISGRHRAPEQRCEMLIHAFANPVNLTTHVCVMIAREREQACAV